jgi:hypothetical protein
MTLVSNWLRGLTALAAVALAVPALAQTPSTYQVAGGYQFLRNDGLNLKRGGYGELEVHIEGPLAIVGQVGSSTLDLTREELIAGVRVEAAAHMTITSYLAGIRVSANRESRVVPYVHLLSGFVHGSASATASASAGGRTATETEETSSTQLGVQAGGGVNLFFSRKAGIQVAADYLGILFDEDVSNAFRLAAGVVIRF